MIFAEARAEFLSLKSRGFNPMMVRFGKGPNYTDERFAVLDLAWAKGKTPDQVETSLKGAK